MNRWRGEILPTAGMAACALLTALCMFLILWFVLREGLPLFLDPEIRTAADPALFFAPQIRPDGVREYVWQPVSVQPKYSLLPLVVGTAKTALTGMAFAVPLALAAAVFTSEFAPRWMREVVKPAIELLAGLPSVVLGLFALMVVADWLQAALRLEWRLNALTAGLVLGVAVLPTVFTVAEDALAAVPAVLREAARGLGASRWQVVWGTVLPAALPGIFAAVLLGLGRALGESMIVAMAAGNAALFSPGLAEPARTLSASIVAEMGEVVMGSPHYHVLFFIGFLLLLVSFLLNLLGRFSIQRLRRRYEGG